MAEVVGLVFAVVGGADLCLRYGRSAIEKYRSYSEADKTLAGLILRLELQWSTLELSLDVLRGVAPSMNNELQCQLNTLFQHLWAKLQETTVLLDSVIGQKGTESKKVTFDRVRQKTDEVKRLRLAFIVKKSMEELIGELEGWQHRAQPIWYLLTLIPNPVIDQQLVVDDRLSKSKSASTLKGLRDAIKRRTKTSRNEPPPSIFISDCTVSPQEKEQTPILYCSTEIMKEARTGDYLLVESFHAPENAIPHIVTESIEDFAHILSAIDPKTFGVLACQGVIKLSQEGRKFQRFHFVFSIPTDLQLYTPRTLRELLIAKPSYPLEERFRLGMQLARSVVFIHTAQFVHKNIRPETIVVFQSPEERIDAPRIGVPFVMGFDSFRPANGQTFLSGDSDWKKNLYRHPTRQGDYPEMAYKMQHDIYSLGVCLLEIGLWGSFIQPDPNAADGFKPGPNMNISKHLCETSTRRKAQAIKAELLGMAKTQLPNKTGTRYSDVVELCLNCLDTADNNFGQEYELLDEDDVLVGVKYIEKILETMEKLSV